LEAEKRIKELREKINDADYKYYVLAEPDIDDYKYDLMMKELEELEEKYPQYKTFESPTQRVSGEPTKKFEVVEHKTPMLSLSNSYNFDELTDFDRRISSLLEQKEYEYVCELKFDGVAVSLIYENGKFIRGATRGDGTKGDNITQNLRTIKSLPLSVKPDFSSEKVQNFEVRGEVIINKEDFLKINEEQEIKGEKLFANARNTAAGTLKLKDSKIVAARPLTLFTYYFSTEDLKLDSHYKNLQYLKEMRFPVSKYCKKVKDIEEVKKYCNEIELIRDELPYEIDGVVVKIDSLRQQDLLGSVSKSPRWAIAYKFKAKEKITKILNVTCQVGRLGTITPVAELEPVFLSGSKISRATLHNFDEIRRKDIRTGDYVKIEKGGEVIPKVVEVIKEKRPDFSKDNSRIYTPPEKCPVCNTKLENPDDEVNYYCPNYFCPAQVKGRIEHFVFRDAMEIEGLGESIIETFLNKGYIKDFADLYELKKYRNELIELERFGEKSINNILTSIENSKQKPFDKVLYAIGIRHVGSRIAKILSQHFDSIGKLASATEDEISNIYEIGPKIAHSIISFFKEEKNLKIIRKLKLAGLNLSVVSTLQKEKAPDNLKIKGKIFVLTGALEKYTRQKATEMIEKLGGRVSSSVSKKTNYVLAGSDSGSKLEKAKKLSIRIINEEEFEKLISG